MRRSPIKPKSLRNQNLGMIGQRVVITGVMPKKSPEARTKTTARNVAVIMGDPKIRDVVKPDAVFDEDDYEAINKLKEALGGLKKFNFKYINHYGSLIENVRKLKG